MEKRREIGFCIKCGKTGQTGSLSCHFMEILVYEDSVRVFTMVHDEITYEIELVHKNWILKDVFNFSAAEKIPLIKHE